MEKPDLHAKNDDHFETAVLTACSEDKMNAQVFESLKNMREIIRQKIDGELTKGATIYPKKPARAA